MSESNLKGVPMSLGITFRAPLLCLVQAARATRRLHLIFHLGISQNCSMQNKPEIDTVATG
jgi:hypothetical protein